IAVVAGALVIAWGYWFTQIPVTLVAVSSSAALKVDDTSYTVDIPLSGTVVSVHGLELGRMVAKGELLVSLDAQRLHLELAEAQARYRALGPQVEALDQEMTAQRSASQASQRSGAAHIDEARARYRESMVQREFADKELERVRSLFASGLVPEAELSSARLEAEHLAARTAALDAESRRVVSESAEAQQSWGTRLATLKRQRASLRGEMQQQQAKIASLEHRIAQHEIRAPAAGRIGVIGEVRVGAVMEEGERAVTLIAAGDMRLVSEFAPADVFGRMHPGQSARVEFDGFPGVEYGRPSATVVRVAGDVRGGLARVELQLDEQVSDRIPRQHGQPATVTIAVDRATPLQLLLRIIGRTATARQLPTSVEP
ncbi:MAG: HlyD family efflux transporter periplasmic adaptor subunit, partial [Myxococcota bacterium]